MQYTKHDEFINAACIWYCRNKTWKSRYEGRSEKVKEYMGYIFAHGYGSLVEEAKADYNALREDFTERIIDLKELHRCGVGRGDSPLRQ